MRLIKLFGKNYFIALLILLGITVLLVVALFLLNSAIPNAQGEEPYQYEILSVSHFEPWAFEADGLNAVFPQGGVMIIVNETDRFKTLILLGVGNFRQSSAALDQVKTSGVFMLIEHDLFDTIRGDNIFIPVEEGPILKQAANIFNKQEGVPNIWKDTIPLAFHGRNGLAFYYLIDSTGKPILPPTTNLNYAELYGTFLIYLIFVLITILVILIFSLDHRYSRYWVHLASTPPGRYSLLLIILIIPLMALSDVIPALLNKSALFASIGYALVIGGLIVSAKYGKIDYLDLGLRRDRAGHGYLLAVMTAGLIVLSAHGLPAGINYIGSETILSLPAVFLLIGLPREMIWRGYIQAILSRRLGANGGLLVMIILASLTRFIFLIATEPWMLTYPYTYLEVAILTPGLAAILGYLYLRTENILACALLHSLMIWLPALLIYQ